jgi:hypothetical protein
VQVEYVQLQKDSQVECIRLANNLDCPTCELHFEPNMIQNNS